MRNKYLVLVNKKSKIRDDWEENIQLVRTKNVWSEDIKIENATFTSKNFLIELMHYLNELELNYNFLTR